jgi:hypothetical protein
LTLGARRQRAGRAQSEILGPSSYLKSRQRIWRRCRGRSKSVAGDDAVEDGLLVCGAAEAVGKEAGFLSAAVRRRILRRRRGPIRLPRLARILRLAEPQVPSHEFAEAAANPNGQPAVRFH